MSALITTIYLMAALLIFFQVDSTGGPSLAELGSFFAGIVGPLSIFWLIVSIFLQSTEIRRNSHAIEEQSRLSQRNIELKERSLTLALFEQRIKNRTQISTFNPFLDHADLSLSPNNLEFRSGAHASGLFSGKALPIFVRNFGLDCRIVSAFDTGSRWLQSRVFLYRGEIYEADQDALLLPECRIGNSEICTIYLHFEKEFFDSFEVYEEDGEIGRYIDSQISLILECEHKGQRRFAVQRLNVQGKVRYPIKSEADVFVLHTWDSTGVNFEVPVGLGNTPDLPDEGFGEIKINAETSGIAQT